MDSTTYNELDRGESLTFTQKTPPNDKAKSTVQNKSEVNSIHLPHKEMYTNNRPVIVKALQEYTDSNVTNTNKISHTTNNNNKSKTHKDIVNDKHDIFSL